MTQALVLPEDFNPKTYLITNTTENGVFHESRKGASFAANLVANGTPQDLELAEKVLDVVIGCQERHEGDRHYGNFLWMLEDDVVQDLNAVQFNLNHLIPLMILYGKRLSQEMQNRLLETIRLGLEEIRRLDVHVAYTNIAILDICNTCLGGELLQDSQIAERGYRKLVHWMVFTGMNGCPFEYNSPTYLRVTLRTLDLLADLVQHEATRIRVKTILARLGVSMALHIHKATGRLAGPHSRAYQPSVVCESEPEVHMLTQWIENGTLPAWIMDVLNQRPDSFQIVETALADQHFGLTTYHSRSFALGVSTRLFSDQSNVVSCHYTRPGAERPGVLYTRYLTNDKWLGDFYHATDRTKSRNLLDEGIFYGMQQGPRAIGLYAPRHLGDIISAKAALIWTQRELADEIWVGHRRIQQLPAEVAPGELVVIGSGDVFMAVQPLTLTDLGRNVSVRLLDIQGDLVLEIPNYRGPKKRFWEMEWPGAFYQGQPQCGFYIEVAERSDYADGQAFARAVSSGTLTERSDPPFTYVGEGERLWSVEYTRDGQTLGLEVDLMAWALKQRWTQDGDPGWPMLESFCARETSSGHIALNGATLDCGKEAAWLFTSPGTGRWVAASHALHPAPFMLTVPHGKVEIDAMSTGMVVWDNAEVTVEAVDLQTPPKVTSGNLVENTT